MTSLQPLYQLLADAEAHGMSMVNVHDVRRVLDSLTRTPRPKEPARK